MGERPDSAGAGPQKTFDWDRLHQRLEAARANVSRDLSQDEIKGLLRARARALARKPVQESAEGSMEVLEFLLTYETYAIELSWIAETCPLTDLTPLPGTPPFVAGIINVRGHIMSVLDLRKFFDLPIKGLTNLNKVIILHNGDMEFGILADEIIGTRSLPLADVQSSLPTLTGIREEYLKGVTRERMVLLDGARLLADRNLIVYQEINE
jgi:purine-binding chemotaxis protein CheW